MAAVIIRNLSDKTHQALKRRARQRGVSTSEEIRAVLDESVKRKVEPVEPVHSRLGDMLVAFGKKHGQWPGERRRSQPQPAKLG